MTHFRKKLRPLMLLMAVLVAAVLAVATVCACGEKKEGAAGTEEPITVAGFGGALGEAETKAYHNPYMEATGNKINILEAEASLAALRLQVKNNKVIWDIVEFAGMDMMNGGKEGLLEPMDKTIIDTSHTWKHGDYSGVMEYGVVSNHFTEGIGYLNKNFKTPPDWADFFDLKKYPGRRAMEKYIQDGTLEHALLGAGVPKEEIYPLDIDAAIKSIETLGDSVVWVDSLAQASQLLVAGDVIMTQTAAGRMTALQQAGIDIGYNPVGTNGGSYFCIPKGAPNKDAAMKFLAWIVRNPQCSTTMAELTGYAGPNKAGNEAAGGANVEYLFSKPEVYKKTIPIDLDWWTTENTEKALKAFNGYLAGQ